MGGLWSRGDGREDARWRKKRLTSGSNGGGGHPAAVGGGEGVHELHSAMGKVTAGSIETGDARRGWLHGEH